MRITGVFLVVLHLLVASAWGDHAESQRGGGPAADWDAWYDGDVQVHVQVDNGEGAVLAPNAAVQLEFEASESAYHLVYAVDTHGQVQLLFPRFWEENGWVRRGRSVKLRPEDFASGRNPWGADGIVYVEVVASPTPFDWPAIGLQQSRRACQWLVDGRPLQISGDPFLAFNDIHRALFPSWNHALFTVDYTWFYIGTRCDAPAYLGYEYERIVVGASPRQRVNTRYRWEWDFGAWCARPMYRKYYIPGKHLVPRSESHVVYRTRYPQMQDQRVTKKRLVENSGDKRIVISQEEAKVSRK